MDAISIAQNIILRYRQAQEREWNPQVSSSLRDHIDEKFLHRPQQLSGLKRKLRPLEDVGSSDCSDHEAGGVTARAQQIRIQPPSSSEASLSPIDTPSDTAIPQSSSPDSPTEQFSDTSSLATPLTMAVPPEITTQTLSGTYLLNRTLSDSSQAVLKMQGVNFVVRSAVAYSNVTVTLFQYTDDDGKKHLDQEQLSTGGIKNFEDRVMDGAWTDKYNWIWGKVHGKSRYVKIGEIEDAYLKEGWSKDCLEGEVVEGYVESLKDKWTAWQIWGFAEVDGQRRHVRKIVATKPGWQDQRIRMVYDWKPAV